MAQQITLLNEYGNFLRFISKADARAIVTLEDGERITKKTYKLFAKPVVPSNADWSPASISASDIKSHLGIPRDNELDIAPGTISAARIKIKAWPLVYDTRAVMVSPRMA